MAQLLFDRLIARADDQGRVPGSAKGIKGACMPLIESASSEQVAQWLAELERHGLIIRYAIAGQELNQIVNWWKYQGSMRRGLPSIWPAPEGWVDLVYGIEGYPTTRIDAQAAAAQEGTATPPIVGTPRPAAARRLTEPNLTHTEPDTYQTKPNPTQPDPTVSPIDRHEDQPSKTVAKSPVLPSRIEEIEPTLLQTIQSRIPRRIGDTDKSFEDACRLAAWVTDMTGECPTMLPNVLKYGFDTVGLAIERQYREGRNGTSHLTADDLVARASAYLGRVDR